MTEPTFSQEAWQAIAGVRAGIDALPFVARLGDGTLARERFAYYLAQDARYLADYGRALAAAAAQSPNAEDTVFWSRAATEAIVVERELHASHLANLTATEPSPTCLAYTSYLLALSTAGSYPVLAAGLLPCFWIYEDVGTRIKDGVADLAAHPYGDWISLYGDPAFAEATRTVRAITDRLAAESGGDTPARMLTAFVTASRLEWMFWDAADRMEDWPIR